VENRIYPNFLLRKKLSNVQNFFSSEFSARHFTSLHSRGQIRGKNLSLRAFTSSGILSPMFYSIISGANEGGNFLKTKLKTKRRGGNSESFGQSAFFCGKRNLIKRGLLVLTDIFTPFGRYFMRGLETSIKSKYLYTNVDK
jgi:hypothetical protein